MYDWISIRPINFSFLPTRMCGKGCDEVWFQDRSIAHHLPLQKILSQVPSGNLT